MKPGDTIWVRVSKADGAPHRWWQARVEQVTADCIVTYTPFGNPVHHNPATFAQAVYDQPWHIRTYYWPGRCYDLLEVYTEQGALYELYSDITSPVVVVGDEIHFIDHELDVYQPAGGVPEIIDQDEFDEAALKYGYTETFMRECYAVAESLLMLMAAWQPAGSGL